MLPEKFVFGERFKLLFKGEKRTGATQHLFLLGIGNHDFPICMAVNPRKAPAVKYPEAELSAPRRADLADVPRRALQRASLSFFLFSA